MAKMHVKHDIYRGRDPREIPQYAIWEASHLLKIPAATLRTWIKGREYDTRQYGTREFEPIIMLPDANLTLLSFINLVEAHVLDSIRYKHQIPLPKVRDAVSYLRNSLNSKHPLADYAFKRRGVDLVIHEAGEILNVSRKGQLGLKGIIESYLDRIEYDSEQGIAANLYPYLKRHPKELEDEPKLVLIDPRISFGKPVLVGVGVPTAIVADRHDAGETIAELADDYGCEASEIAKAIEYERALPKAA
jgi:uncharacterized protein (DUF433 family)